MCHRKATLFGVSPAKETDGIGRCARQREVAELDADVEMERRHRVRVGVAPVTSPVGHLKPVIAIHR
jgi:hypothetical protein